MKKKPITINLNGPDGNAFVIMAKVVQRLQEEGWGSQVNRYIAEATSGDYENLKNVSRKFVSIRFVEGR